MSDCCYKLNRPQITDTEQRNTDRLSSIRGKLSLRVSQTHHTLWKAAEYSVPKYEDTSCVQLYNKLENPCVF